MLDQSNQIMDNTRRTQQLNILRSYYLFLVFTFLPAFKGFTQQKFKTKQGEIAFFSSTPIEDIKAKNKKVASILREDRKEDFVVPMNQFNFPIPLMQAHFNENYVDSEKFPHSFFDGYVEGITKDQYTKNGIYPVKISGKLTIKGTTKQINERGKIVVKDAKPNAICVFEIQLDDYKIKIPKIMYQKIAQTIRISVNISYEKVN